MGQPYGASYIWYRLKLLSITALAILGLTGVLWFPMIVEAQNTTISTVKDCDDNAVIFCGASSVSELTNKYSSGDGHNSAASIHAIFSFFGISSTDVTSMSGNSVDVQAGKVSRAGNVHDANGNIVATGAMTGGRQNMPGSTQHTSGGTVFFSRPPSVSFQSNSLDAFVVMVNGRFSFAILASCGNPVKATPSTPGTTPQPNASLSKLVSLKDSSGSFQKSISAPAGSHVIFSITAKSIGNTPASNLKVTDQLPAGLTLVPGTLQHNGKPSAGEGSFFSSGIATPNLSTETTFVFEAVVGQNDTATSCQPETLTNTASMTATSIPSQTSTATVTKTCATPPTQPTPVTPAVQQQQQQQQNVVINNNQPAAPAEEQPQQEQQQEEQPVTPAVAPQQQPQQPKTLVNTGPGSMISLFTLMIIATVTGYRWFLSRYVQ